MLTSDRRNVDAAEHAGDFLDPCISLESGDLAANLPCTARLADLPLPVGACGNLWQVRHTEDLSFASQLAQQTADHFGNPTTDSDVDLVEDQGRYACCLTGHHLDGEADTREFAS